MNDGKDIRLQRTKHGFSVRIRCGKKQHPRFRIALTDEREALERAQRMTELARMLVAAGAASIALDILKPAGLASAERFEDAVAVVADECRKRKKTHGASAARHVTFRELAERWTSGKLAAEHPDHVKAKASSDVDEQRLRKLYPAIGTVPLTEFTLAHAKRAMKAIPEGRQPGTRRHYAQLISRVLRLAAWPCEIIAQSPLPRGFLPKPAKRPAFSSLRPAEDATLLACIQIPFAVRLLYALLAREGMRLGEARRLLWRHLDLEHGVLRLDVNKTGEPRVWALSADVARVMKRLWEGPAAWGAAPALDEHVFSREVIRNASREFRANLKLAGIDRPELFERTPHRRPIRVHDLRATFITIGLAQGRSEAWICDRTGHKSSVMVNAYRRAARTATELNLGTLRELDACMPELRPDPQGVPRVCQTPASAEAVADETSMKSEECAREGSNLHALRRWNLNRAIWRRSGPNGGVSEGCRAADGLVGARSRPLPTVCRQFMRLSRDQGIAPSCCRQDADLIGWHGPDSSRNFVWLKAKQARELSVLFERS
jgi:integrase